MIRKIICIITVLFTALLFPCCNNNMQQVTIGTLLDEMTDFIRLSTVRGMNYKTIQYSSYDRRSISPDRPGWFANEDGFGEEPVPGFMKVITPPDSSGKGVYLICDATGPGVIQRLWSASITGTIRLFIDSQDIPVYEGNAQDFFQNTLKALSNGMVKINGTDSFRQFDASYFPVPFSGRCRIEWTGSIKEPHFYHVGLRLYEKGTSVESFSKKSLSVYEKEIIRTDSLLRNQNHSSLPPNTINESRAVVLEPGNKAVVLNISGPGSVIRFSAKIKSSNLKNTLRQTLLKITFDNAAIPQVEAPVGDFFCTLPEINPFISLPVSVLSDSTMICRFVMPFKENARIELENHSSEDISFSSGTDYLPGKWQDGKSMHFHAHWSISNDLTTGDEDSLTNDILYLNSSGQGRIVGAAALLHNPSNVPTSWGNWWGEGDEKIFIDSDTFPSYFGTGSEDYFNYSWSSSRLFSYPYCGQPMNEGPGNRGYVTNFRWHISDDIPFSEKIAFFMELRHHGIVKDFSYARIVYFYRFPGSSAESGSVKSADLREISYLPWSPLAFKGSSGWKFIQAEEITENNKYISTEYDNFWANGKILKWTPPDNGKELKLSINSSEERIKTRIGLTMANTNDAGALSFQLNDQPVRFGNRDTLSLLSHSVRFLDNYFSEEVYLKKGRNELTLRMTNADKNRSARIDFLWMR